MKKLFLIFFAFCLGLPLFLQAQSNGFIISGTVTDAGTSQPLEMVLVSLPEYGLWATTNAKGQFSIKKVPAGATTVKVDYLGYVTQDMKITVARNIENISFKLKEDNLSLPEVTVTAAESKSAATTTRTIEKQAIEHLQVVNASDILSLLPGGTTQKQDLTTATQINLRGDITNGFGTAVVMDGVRLSNNSNMSLNSSTNAPTGIDTRSIGASNIESIEVITGVPSVEYGDMTAGMVIVNTKKGRTPFVASVSLNPTTKQVAVNKGFELGKDRGILNVNAEYAHAFRNPVSRYTTYYRNTYGINYSKTFNKEGRPVLFNVNLNGGLARQQEKNDPDAYTGTWAKSNDNNVRFGASAKWLVNASWITNVEFKVTGAYSDQLSQENIYYSSPSIQPSINSVENGYFETNYLPVQFYNLYNNDSKGVDFTAGVKAVWNKKIGKVNNNIKIGFTWSNSGNVGKGIYYDDDLKPNGFRERPYTDIPFLNSYAEYIEDHTTIPIGKTTLSLIAGVRIETLHLKEMAYNSPTSVSPRFNGKYTIVENKRKGFLRGLSVRGAWGELEKLPSLGLLYPENRYNDILVYNKTYGANNNVFAAAKTLVYTDAINPDMKWAKNRNIEAGIDANLGGIKVSLIYFNNKAKNAYQIESDYVPYAYMKTDESIAVPDNPSFRVDKITGDIFVSDLNNMASGEVLLPKSVVDTTFIRKSRQANKYPVTTQGLELSINFGQIKAIRTSFLLDASYSYTKDVDETLNPVYPGGSHSSLPSNQNRSYEFVGYYLGGTNRTQTYNGTAKNTFNANFTIVTHIPEIRLTVSARLEAALYNSTDYLTYYNGKEWAYLVDDNGNRIDGSVYNQKEYATGVWPVAYASFDGVVKQFTEKEASDPRFSYLIGRQNQTYRYVRDGYDPFFMANISVTKEIGRIASISLYVNNFTNTSPMVRYWASGLYQASKNISFSYGASVRLTF